MMLRKTLVVGVLLATSLAGQAGAQKGGKAPAVDPRLEKLKAEAITMVEGADVRVQAMLQICGVYPICPTIADLGLEGSSGEVEPRLVEVGTALVWARNPNE